MNYNIDPESYYSVREIFNHRFFNWINSYSTLIKWVKKDVDHGNLEFRAVVSGMNSGKRYLVKGETLIKILNKAKEGTLIQNYEQPIRN